MTKIENKEYYTTHETASLLFVKAATVVRWARDGKIKTIKTLGGHRRIPSSEIDRIKKLMIELGNGGRK